MRTGMHKHDYDVIETLLTMVIMSVVMAFGVLGFIGLVFNIEIFAIGKMVVFGWIFGLTGIFFSILLIRNWNQEKH